MGQNILLKQYSWCYLYTTFTSGLAASVQCNFTFNTHLFANTVAVDKTASGQELLAHLLNIMDQQHNSSMR